MFIGFSRFDGFIQHQARCLRRLFKESKKLFARGWIAVFSRGICQKHQTSLREEWHGIDSIVQIVFAHGTRIKTRAVNSCAGGVREIRLKVFELARDGEFVVAEEEINVGHGLATEHTETAEILFDFLKELRDLCGCSYFVMIR